MEEILHFLDRCGILTRIPRIYLRISRNRVLADIRVFSSEVGVVDRGNPGVIRVYGCTEAFRFDILAQRLNLGQ